MSKERTILDYLEDISIAILDIRSFVHDMSAEAFMADKKTANAVVGLEVIGEATCKIPRRSEGNTSMSRGTRSSA